MELRKKWRFETNSSFLSEAIKEYGGNAQKGMNFNQQLTIEPEKKEDVQFA